MKSYIFQFIPFHFWRPDKDRIRRGPLQRHILVSLQTTLLLPYVYTDSFSQVVYWRRDILWNNRKFTFSFMNPVCYALVSLCRVRRKCLMSLSSFPEYLVLSYCHVQKLRCHCSWSIRTPFCRNTHISYEWFLSKEVDPWKNIK